MSFYYSHFINKNDELCENLWKEWLEWTSNARANPDEGGLQIIITRVFLIHQQREKTGNLGK